VSDEVDRAAALIILNDLEPGDVVQIVGHMPLKLCHHCRHLITGHYMTYVGERLIDGVIQRAYSHKDIVDCILARNNG